MGLDNLVRKDQMNSLCEAIVQYSKGSHKRASIGNELKAVMETVLSESSAHKTCHHADIDIEELVLAHVGDCNEVCS